jgi:selenocysteine-specific elongation factor
MTMPLLEFFDERGFTVRIAEGRRIRADWRVLAPANLPIPTPGASDLDPTDIRVSG